MLEQIDHVALAVRDLGKAVDLYAVALGARIRCQERHEDQGFEMACFDVGESAVELLAPLRADSVIGKFLARRGEGIHHVAFRVNDVNDALQRCSDAGLDLVDSEPRRGTGDSQICFLHPRGTMGALVELVQAPNNHDDAVERKRAER